ncbi:hypothetical protein E0485_06905 [Paenibacillus albiflavus]|uniref:Uncharacterized protein n=1 Tax=Paenibacillus albiflavus TaxID=2545760 RepID=A0A4R4EG98_9BACL|nr:hypothetical protein [Paenibacillus albiflavus]TCZ78799.1 hypothetical protein E0485_06905 [Paenibacillus albiflavus]
MRNFGVILLILGIGGFILPYFGIQFKIFNKLGEYETIGEIAAIVIGAILVVISLMKSKNNDTSASA